jgi:hypothetical protein
MVEPIQLGFRMRLIPLLPLLLMTALARAQTPVPIATHVLDAGKLAHSSGLGLTMSAVAPQSVIAMGSDRSTLFALVPQEERRWQLQMLTGWETASPSVRTLFFDGDDSLDKEDFMSASMTPTPDGKTMFVRIFVYNLKRYERSADLLMIDLSDFRVVSRRVTANPLVANSRWFFGGTGGLIAAEGPSPVVKMHDGYIPLDVLDMNPISIGDHEAALLSLPTLTPSLKCGYSVESVTAGDRRAELIDDQCKEVLRQADAKSVFEFSKPPDGRTALPYYRRIGCPVQSVSERHKHVLTNCHGNTDLNGEPRAKFRSEQVESDNGQVVLDVHVGLAEDLSATLGTLSGRDYLLLLRKGSNLSVYELP